MSNNVTNKVTVSFPIFGAIGLILVILKLAGVDPVATWSWWLVTLPFWFGFVVVGVFMVVMLVVGLIAAALAAIFSTSSSRKRLTRRRW